MFLRENSSFPPDNEFYQKLLEWGAWYSGERDYLIEYYKNCTVLPITENNIFWAKIEQSERINMVHIPAAGDIAEMSSNLLFSEAPKIGYKKESKLGDMLTNFIDESGFFNILLESAEVSAAFGGVLLKSDIDIVLSKFPLISILTPMQFYPTFLRGRLWEVLMWREVKREGSNKETVWRLFENRKRNNNGKDLIIEFKLYKGKNDNIGKEYNLNSIDETKELNLKEKDIINNVNGLGAVYIPNKRPNKLRPGSPIGINDFNSSISLLDSLDAAWSSLMNDIELGRGQIFIDEELMKSEDSLDGTNLNSKQTNSTFSKYQKAFLQLNFSNYKMGNDNYKPIDVNQFEIRTDDHLKACTNLYQTIVSNCGYSPQTFGINIDGGRAESGTSLRIRERKSLLTKEKKSRYWQIGIKDILRQISNMYASYQNINFDVETNDISVELEDSIVIDSREQSETIRNLDMAKAISTYIKVKMLHPDWNDIEVEEEIKKINKESGADFNNDVFDLDKYSNQNNNNEEQNKKIESKEG